MRKDIKDILERIASGEYNKQDEEIAKRWIFTLRKTNSKQISEAELEKTSEQMWKEITKNRISPVRTLTIWTKTASIAAAILVMGIVGYYVYQYQKPTLQEESQIVNREPISTNRNRAYLTTESGETIALSTEKSGLVIGEEILYTDGSRVEGFDGGDMSVENLTITVPKAGLYQLQLPDGTKVWLNAMSSLRYPVAFDKHERVVEATGEVYFDVKSDENRPFFVQIDGLKVEVTGTKFNVHSFEDESYTQITLAEGAVIVHSNKGLFSLKPGKQLNWYPDTEFANVETVNLDEYLSWKEGVYSFKYRKLEEVLRVAQRWFDVEFLYNNSTVKSSRYTGILLKEEKLDDFLKRIETTSNFKFSISNNQVTVN